jgi:hypothetical protein
MKLKCSINLRRAFGMVSTSDKRSRVRVDQCVSAFREVEAPEFVCLRSSCSHVIEVAGQ